MVQRSHSTSDVVVKIQITYPEMYVNKKRKAGDRASLGKKEDIYKKKVNAVAIDLIENIETLVYKLDTLNKRISENVNTKREIKEVNLDLQKIGINLNKASIRNLLDRIKWEKAEVMTVDADVLTDVMEHGVTVNRTKVTQDNFQHRMEWERAEHLPSQIWEEDSHKRVLETEGNPLSDETTRNLALLTGVVDGRKNALVKRVIQRHPQLERIVAEERLAAGRIVYVEASETVALKEEALAGEEKTTTCTYLLG